MSTYTMSWLQQTVEASPSVFLLQPFSQPVLFCPHSFQGAGTICWTVCHFPLSSLCNIPWSSSKPSNNARPLLSLLEEMEMLPQEKDPRCSLTSRWVRTSDQVEELIKCVWKHVPKLCGGADPEKTLLRCWHFYRLWYVTHLSVELIPNDFFSTFIPEKITWCAPTNCFQFPNGNMAWSMSVAHMRPGLSTSATNSPHFCGWIPSSCCASDSSCILEIIFI